MENPDAVLELKRDEHGLITEVSYKVPNPGEENRRAMEFSELASEMFRADGPEDHSTSVKVDVLVGE